ncbi:MAG: TonB-dependent receptor plug domain-containing protein, partial [Longimicrobiales bacterium]|nr:TonB-dependent receptor plug domain-containing protein [Longimicrobiales bacterium]
VRLAVEAIELEALVVEAETARTRAERAQGSSLHVVDRRQIERALGTSKHLGDLIRQTIPGIRLHQSNNLAGTDVCLEFRTVTISLVQAQACNHPMVVVDGVPVTNPNFLYGTIGLDNIERIQMIPPGEAGARYGTGSLYGVLLIETRSPGTDRTGGDRRVSPLDQRKSAFDWGQDPAGHNMVRTSAWAFLGNAAGLAAGVAIARRCITVDRRDQIVTSCGTVGDAAAILAAMALPAAASALGAHWGGATATSQGRLLPAVLGAGMMLFPGYAFSLATVGSGSDVANGVGAVMLVVGTPFLVTMADRMFRKLR